MDIVRVTLPDKIEPERQSQRPAVSFETVAVGRQRRRVDGGLVIVGLAVLLVVVAVARPWAGSATPPVVAVRSSSPAPHPSIPATVALSNPLTSMIAAAQSALARVMLDPAGYAHQWGVAIGSGTSPGGRPAFDIGTKFPIISIAMDGSWATWAGVQPVSAAGPSSSTSVPSARLSPTELCTGLPRLPAGPQVLEITTSTGPPDGLAVAAWRNSGLPDDSGGPQPISDLQLVGRSDGLGVGFLQRRNGLAWPDGRYLFTVFGSVERTLAVCLGQP